MSGIRSSSPEPSARRLRLRGCQYRLEALCVGVLTFRTMSMSVPVAQPPMRTNVPADAPHTESSARSVDDRLGAIMLLLASSDDF